MPLPQAEIDFVVGRLKDGASPDAVHADLCARGVGEAEARTTVDQLVGLKLEVDLRAAAVDMARKGYLWEPLETAIRGKGLAREQEDAILAEVRPQQEKARAEIDRRQRADASTQRDFAVMNASGDRRRGLMYYGQLGLGLFLLLAGIGLTIVSMVSPMGRVTFVFTGVTVAGAGLMARTYMRGRHDTGK